MPLRIFTPPQGGSAIAFWLSPHTDANGYADMFIPKAGKDEWGIDTLERQMRGPFGTFDAFYNALRQGQTYTSNGVTYYLQTIKPIEDKITPGASLSYKGLPFGIPAQLVSGAEVELSGTITVSSPQKASRSLRYASWKTVYRYIKNSKPTGAANTTIDVNVTPTVTFSEITDGNGNIIYGNAPAGLVSALTPTGYDDIATLEGYNPIIGTPYFECTDSVVRMFPIQ